MVFDGAGEAQPVALEVEPQRGGRDHVEGDPVEFDAAVAAQAGQAGLGDREGVLGEVDQCGARLDNGEAAERGRAAGD